ncbi:MAG: hypothetical protein EAZ11_12300 [Curvibacter sp.]|nr:MAG: hypothetical protein EAZ11_12300 [Curvibacter sp.]
MFSQRLADFSPIAPGQVATVKVPRYALTFNRLMLRLGGTTFTKALISKIEIMIGTRRVYLIDSVGALAAGTILDMINRYRGVFDQATNLTIDFTERDFLTIAAREIGGIDMSKITDDVYVNITIAGGAVAPTLYANAFYTPPQGRDIEDTQLIQKLVTIPYSFANGGRQQITFDPKGALIKRIYATFTGSNGTATAESNLSRFEVRKNSNALFELLSTDNKFLQQEYRKVPQSGMFVVDLVFDNNLSGALVTADAAALEFAPTFTAADNGVMIFEVLDAPYNL